MDVREGWVESQGHRLAYLAVNEHLAHEGEPAIVFIHGVLASVNFWLNCVPPEYAKNRAWYSLSLPAHHPSTAPEDFKLGDVDDEWFFRIMSGALKDLLGEQKAILVGHSTGGFCALNLAAHNAQNLVGVVSVAGFYRGQWGGVEGLLLQLASLGKWARGLFGFNIAVSQQSTFVRRRFAELLAHDRKAFRQNPLSRQMLEDIEPDTVAHCPDALFTLFHGIASLDIRDRLRRVSIPCHVFFGTDDPVVPVKQSRTLRNDIPGARSVEFRGVGHMPFLEDTGEYFKALTQSLDQIREQVSHHELSGI